MKAELKKKIDFALQDLIKRYLESHEIDLEQNSDLRVWGCDSVTIIELIVELESMFKIEFGAELFGSDAIYQYSFLKTYILENIKSGG